MKLQDAAGTVIRAGLVYGAYAVLVKTNYSPVSWDIAALCIWLLFLLSRSWAELHKWDLYQVTWGFLSLAAFNTFITTDADFKGWGDVYYFCGRHMRYCTCDMRWNLAGWGKAAVLWNFILSTALAVQKLVIQVGLAGLLPGEEVVTKESFISICWRLVPYWLNNWEQQWGAECSSMMFELPHFAVELLIVLPCVQIICARLKILALPLGRGIRPNNLRLPAAVRDDPQQMALLAPQVMQGVWRPLPNQHLIMERIRSNLRILLMVVAVIALASCNALHMPLSLERQIFQHQRTAPLLAAAAHCRDLQDCWMQANLGSFGADFRSNYTQRSCQSSYPLVRNMAKHSGEILKMQAAAHADLIPLVETALAIMRLSCERFFVLISVFIAYLLFRNDVPLWFRCVIRINHKLSKLFQQVILYSFPAVCWIYGAGAIFSTFVSLVFWGGPIRTLSESLRKHATVVQPMGLQDTTEAQIEQMNGNCAVCWSEMVPSRSERSLPQYLLGHSGPSAERIMRSKALPCGHAFHEECIHQWLKQCHGQGRQASCPMCNRQIHLSVRYKVPLPWRLLQDVPPIGPNAAPQEGGLLVFLLRELQGYFLRREQRRADLQEAAVLADRGARPHRQPRQPANPQARQRVRAEEEGPRWVRGGNPAPVLAHAHALPVAAPDVADPGVAERMPGPWEAPVPQPVQRSTRRVRRHPAGRPPPASSMGQGGMRLTDTARLSSGDTGSGIPIPPGRRDATRQVTGGVAARHALETRNFWEILGGVEAAQQRPEGQNMAAPAVSPASSLPAEVASGSWHRPLAGRSSSASTVSSGAGGSSLPQEAQQAMRGAGSVRKTEAQPWASTVQTAGDAGHIGFHFSAAGPRGRSPASREPCTRTQRPRQHHARSRSSGADTAIQQSVEGTSVAMWQTPQTQGPCRTSTAGTSAVGHAVAEPAQIAWPAPGSIHSSAGAPPASAAACQQLPLLARSRSGNPFAEPASALQPLPLGAGVFAGLQPEGGQMARSIGVNPFLGSAESTSSRSMGGLTSRDLQSVVERDLDRVRSYLQLCQSMELRFQGLVRRGSGALEEAQANAAELLRNAEELQGLLHQQASRGGAGTSGEEQYAAVWARQHALWQRSQALFQELSHLTPP